MTRMLAAYALLIANTAIADAFDTILNINSSTQIAPNSIGSNTQLNLSDVGVLPHEFEAGNSDGTSTNIEVNISGGTVGPLFMAFANTQVNVTDGFLGANLDLWMNASLHMSGGTISDSMDARTGSTAVLTGGTVGSRLDVFPGASLTIAGAHVGDQLSALKDSHIEILGGSVGSRAAARGYSTLRIAGGSIGAGFQAYPNSRVDLFGLEFFLDGQPINGLLPETPLKITDRNTNLTGTLADGSDFQFYLSDTLYDSGGLLLDYFDREANLTIHLVPEPNAVSLLHYIVLGCLVHRKIVRRVQKDCRSKSAVLADSK